MNRLPIYSLGCLLLLSALSCQPSSPPESTKAQERDRGNAPVVKVQPTSQQLAEVIQAYRDHQRQFDQRPKKAPVTGQAKDERGKTEMLAPDPEVYASRLIEIIQDNRGDRGNLAAIQWILKEVPSGPNFRTAIELLRMDYIETEPIADVLPVLVEGYPDPASMQLMEQLAENSLHNRVRAVAKMAHIKGHQAILRFVVFLDNPKWTERMKSFVEKSTLEFYRKSATQNFDLESKLQELNPSSIYGEYDFGVKNQGRPAQNIGQLATNMLFSLQHLQVGKPAPNIQAEDLDGLTFSLKEYRGKIVMLDFWGDW